MRSPQRDRSVIEIEDSDASSCASDSTFIDASMHGSESGSGSEAGDATEDAPMEDEFQECIICRDSVPLVSYPEQPTTSQCTTHTINVCLDCLAQHLEAEINGKGETIGVKCPISGCRTLLHFDDVKRLADPAIFDRYDNLLLRKAVQAVPEFRWCKRSKCGSGHIHEGGSYDIYFLS
ncbi:hypothetical protein RQP46_011399 [Phenoliferia psychrophenolica]